LLKTRFFFVGLFSSENIKTLRLQKRFQRFLSFFISFFLSFFFCLLETYLCYWQIISNTSNNFDQERVLFVLLQWHFPATSRSRVFVGCFVSSKFMGPCHAWQMLCLEKLFEANEQICHSPTQHEIKS
jgi:hypothetical protein